MAVEVDGTSGEDGTRRRTIGGIEEEVGAERAGEDRGVVFMDRLTEEDMGVFRRRA